jgi:serine/threonine-protein kinase
MARITPDELWRVVVAAGLCTPRAAAVLRADHDRSAAAADSAAVAAWLVDRRVLTPWQAKRLVAGDDGPFLVGDYRLLERHAHAGEVREYTARHQSSGRIVTLVLLPRKPWRERVVREAFHRRLAIAARAADPLLVRVEAHEEVDGRPLVVCEEVRGEALADELARRGPLPLREAGEITLDVARALAELHAAGAVHGGLSLDALVREPQVAGGRLRLRQFPLATDPLAVPPRAPVATEEQVASLGRQAAFVAPELVAGAACDPRSDVYALGCMLHALVTGRIPGWRGDAHETLASAAASGPGPLDATAPAPLATLVDYLTARDPQDRYPDAAEAARGIAACFGLPACAAALPVDGGLPASAGVAPPPVPAPDARARRAAAAEAARRRGGRLRLVGRAIAGAILLAAASLVVVRSLPEAVRRGGRPRPAAGQGPAAPQREPQARVIEPAAAAPRPPAGPARMPAPAAGPRGPTIVDDPSLPWASPTEQSPLLLAYLPAGSRVVVSARPADLFTDDEGRLFVRALGPRVERALAAVAAACGCRPEDIDSLQAGWQAEGTDDAVVGWTARLVEGTTLPADDAFRARAWGPPAPAARAGETIHAGPRLSYWAPTSAAGRVLVAAPAARLAEIVVASADADPPPLVLPSDLERLVDGLHGTRHLTVVGAPHFLLNAGRARLAGALAPLAAGVEWLVGEAVPAAALSVHCGDDFFMELDAVAAVDERPADVAARLKERIAGLPAAVEALCAARDLHPFGRALVMKLPTMVRVLAAHVRSGSEGRVAVATVRLPRPAGHNIALAAELLLAQAAGGGPAAAASAAPQDALERLGRTMTLRFEKDTLEKAIQMISDEIGVPLEILGPDLQQEGITKNQSFAIDERDKPAADILRVVLAKANPDGKLVYVVRQQDGVESIAITTRGAVARRGDALPPALREDGGTPVEDSK